MKHIKFIMFIAVLLLSLNSFSQIAEPERFRPHESTSDTTVSRSELRYIIEMVADLSRKKHPTVASALYFLLSSMSLGKEYEMSDVMRRENERQLKQIKSSQS